MIRFLITGQQLQIVTPIVVADTHNYQSAQATFNGELWNGCTKWAHFKRDSKTYDVPFLNDEIGPDQGLDLTAGTWQVYLTGHAYDAGQDTVTVRITTSTALLKVESAGADTPFPPVTPELSEVLAAKVVDALNVAEGVRKDAIAGAFNGATFTPSVTGSGDLSWSNDKGLPDPPPVNIKGEAGRPGKDFTILGYYADIGSLEAAVVSPAPGAAYGVGASQPYDIYIWDAVGERWVNNGPVQGAQGDPGKDATINGVSVRYTPHGTRPSVTNTGTPSAAVFEFALPEPKTPEKGVDYMTEQDKLEIAGLVTVDAIGAVPDPSTKNKGDTLVWNGAAWVAQPPAGGVSSVNGESGAVVTRVIAQNVVVSSSDWIEQSQPTNPGFPWAASKAISNVTASMMPMVTFAAQDAASGLFAPVADTYSGGVYIYAKRKPASNITIPIIVFLA